MIYTSGSLALAALEYLVHVAPENAPNDLIALTIEFPETSGIEIVSVDDLPKAWEKTADSTTCKKVGDKWLTSAKTLILRVPSAPIPSEHNYLINPAVDGMSKVKLVSKRRFTFDPRLA